MNAELRAKLPITAAAALGAGLVSLRGVGAAGAAA